MSRHSIKNALRQARGTIGACARTEIRYAKDANIELRLKLAAKYFREGEKQLRFAERDAIEAAHRRREAPAPARRRAA